MDGQRKRDLLKESLTLCINIGTCGILCRLIHVRHWFVNSLFIYVFAVFAIILFIEK